MTGKRARWVSGLLAAVTVTTAGCGSAVAGAGTAGSSSLPAGVMSAAQACRRVVETSGRGSLRGIEQVQLVLTTYAKGEPVESGGDISSGMPPRTLVWVVAVHAKTVNVPYSHPSGYKQRGRFDSYSVVMNARTGQVTDSGMGRGWPLPLWKAGTVIRLSGRC
jgi:hypothetical protein